MTMSATTKVRMTTDGRSGYESTAMRDALFALEDSLGYPRGTLTITQFGYMGTSSFSGSTHGKDAADLSYYQHDKKAKNGRRLGLWVAPRTVADGGGTWSVAHCHVGLIGGGANSDAMNGQIAEYLRGGDGLNGNVPDRYWRPRYPNVRFVYGAPKRRWQAIRPAQGYDQAGGHADDKLGGLRPKGYVTGHENIATVHADGEDWLVFSSMLFFRKADFKAYVPPAPTPIRALTLNVADKMPDQKTRAKQNAATIKANNVTLVGAQECTGIEGPGDASDYATMIDTALGEGWYTIKPTTPLNENYIWYFRPEWLPEKQLADQILRPANSPGRHATRCIFKKRDTSYRVLHIDTHLVENVGGVDHSTQRQAMGKIIADGIVAARKVETFDGVLITGDMNTTDDIAAFLAIGLVNTRKTAMKTTDADHKSFRSGRTSGATALGKPIDQIYVSADWHTSGFTVDQDAVGSDHVAVVVSCTATA